MIRDMDDVSTPKGKRVRGADGLTLRQRQVLDIIREHIKIRNLPPSRAELADHLGLVHPSAVAGHLLALEKAGWLETYPSVERGIRLLREGAPLYEDPAELLAEDTPPRRGRIGEKRTEPQRVDSFEDVAALFETPPNLLLRITDDSLDEVGYKPGDIAVVARDFEPRDGDVVVVQTASGVVLRHYQGKEGSEDGLLGVVVGRIVTGRETERGDGR